MSRPVTNFSAVDYPLSTKKRFANEITPCDASQDAPIVGPRALGDAHHPPSRRRLFESSSGKTDTAFIPNTELKYPRKLNYSDESSIVNRSNSPIFSVSNVELDDTQPNDYTQDSAAIIDDIAETWLIQDLFTKASAHVTFEFGKNDFSIGRGPTNDHVVSPKNVSNEHARLSKDPVLGTVKLRAIKDCWVQNVDTSKWGKVACGHTAILRDGNIFRLTPPPSGSTKPETEGLVFRLFSVGASGQPKPGSESFDRAYQRLLRLIKLQGVEQTNKKGTSLTLRNEFVLEIDLADESGRCLLPITTLRYLYQGRAAVIESLWYIRGEDNIRFLQEHRCHFWDAQAKDDGFIGLSYGLLTNFPGENGNDSINQLELNVISKLCRGESSRNMYITLANPLVETVQQSCSSGIQFSVSAETLDMTVNQRSSDVVLGLPNDVVVWAVIYHLVRREVKKRSQRCLRAGKISFVIARGGAHVYNMNMNEMEELLNREPVLDVQPEMIVDCKAGEKGMFDIAKNYKKDGDTQIRVSGYTTKTAHPLMRIQQACEALSTPSK